MRVGLIGCGKMGVQHIRAILAEGSADVVGIADPKVDRAQLASLLPSGVVVCDSAETLLRDLRPEVVHIVTPPATHGDLACQAIDAGCHVYVEKPFTPTRREAEAVLARAAARGVQVCAGHQYLWERPARQVRETLSVIGPVSHVESHFSFNMVRRTISRVEQTKDILPHAVYPLVEQLRLGSGLAEAPIELRGLRVRPGGDVFAILELGPVTGLLIVTLNGRPVEQYQHLSGAHGWLRADYVTGSVVKVLGTGTGPGILLTPYLRASQTLSGATLGFARLLTRRGASYPGLTELVKRFYESIRTGSAAPVSPASILDTVGLCERIAHALDQAEQEHESEASRALTVRQLAQPPVATGAPFVLVTGGTGLLGRRVSRELQQSGHPVRVLARRVPPPSAREPGVSYVSGDLAQGLSQDTLRGVGAIVHCAAETSGGADDHKRNSIAASRQLVDDAARAGVTRLIHISSLAVLKPSHQSGGRPLSEDSPVDAGNPGRGPYVWGKAESELEVRQLARERGLDVRVIRPGPLVDYDHYHPPGRLGRELGPLFVAIGGKRSPLSVCDVGTAARVIRWYVDDFDAAPPLLNLVEAPAPTRLDLWRRYLSIRPDLTALWFPAWLLRGLSAPLKLVQRVVFGSNKIVDVYAAFASEKYDTSLAQVVIERAGPSRSTPITAAAVEHV